MSLLYHVTGIDHETGEITIERKKPAQGEPERALKVMRYYNPNKKKDMLVEVDLELGEREMISHWEREPTRAVMGTFNYAVNQGWLCKKYLMEPENEFGPVCP